MRRGNLIVPNHIEEYEVSDAEFGTIHTVTGNDGYLYAAPPTKKIIKLTKNKHSTKHKVSADSNDGYPAIVMDRYGQMGALVQAKLEDGQQVIAKALAGYEDVLEVITFKHVGVKQDDMPETGNDIEITGRGYASKAQFKKLTTQAPKQTKKKKRINAEAFHDDHRDIFPNDNLIDDVRQSIFGDCFLLASVIAILNSPGGEDYIKGMMKQSDDGLTTIVRLYHPERNEWVYIRVDNSSYYQNGLNTVRHKAPWVHILEKAYTALALKKNVRSEGENIEKYSYAFPSFREIFGTGSEPEAAFAILTGREDDAKLISIHGLAETPWQSESLLYCMMLYKRVEDLLNIFKDDQENIIALDNFLSHFNEQNVGQLKKLNILNTETLNGEEVNISAAYAEFHHQLERLDANFADRVNVIFSAISEEETQLRFLRALANYIAEFIKLKIETPIPITNILKDLRHVTQMGRYVEDIMLQDKWDEFFEILVPVKSCEEQPLVFIEALGKFQPKPPQEIFDKFNVFIRNGLTQEGRVWDGMLGTGIYTNESENIFRDIKAKLQPEEGYSLVASTADSFPEGKVPGLRNKHSYAILDAYEDSELGLKFIRVRNPWGDTGREYHWEEMQERQILNQDIAEENKDAAEFDIELSDFIRYFRGYTEGKFNPVPKHQHNADENVEPAADQQYYVPNKKLSFFSRCRKAITGHWKAISATTTSFAISGAAVGAGLGTLAAVGGFIPTFGLSIFAIPAFAGIGFVAGAVTGATFGFVGGLIVDSRAETRSQENEYVSINQESEGRQYVKRTRAEKGKELESDNESENESDEEFKHEIDDEEDEERLIIPTRQKPPSQPKMGRHSIFFSNSLNADDHLLKPHTQNSESDSSQEDSELDSSDGEYSPSSSLHT